MYMNIIRLSRGEQNKLHSDGVLESNFSSTSHRTLMGLV